MNENKTISSRRIGGLITVVATLFLVMLMALPGWAATFSFDLPAQVIRGDGGERVPLQTETTPEAFVGQICSVTATGNNNTSVHLGNNIELVSGNTVTLFGVEDEENKTTVGDGPLTLTDTITVTLILGEEDAVYSAGLTILLDCGTTTTEPPEETTTTLTDEDTTTTTGEDTTTTVSIGVTTTSTVPTEVGGTVITTTTTTAVGDEVAGTEVLPFTGANWGPMLPLAAIALALGVGLIVATKRDET